MISPEQWAVLNNFRTSIEAEYVKQVLGKPERLPAYEETINTLRESLDRYGIDKSNPDEVYFLLAGIVSALSFISTYFNMVCNDGHMMAHLSETGVFLGYLVRELCYDADAPLLGATA